jgi:inosine-uridine nucleoside N-ribohydrolase
MPPLSHPSVTHWYNQFEPPVKTGDGTALSGLTDFLRSIPDGEKASIVITGPCTNIAALRLLHPELYDRKVDRVVVMGGALGIPQWTPWAEFNIAVDPDALDVLLKSEDVPVVLVPLNVTHQAIFGEEVHARLLDP